MPPTTAPKSARLDLTALGKIKSSRNQPAPKAKVRIFLLWGLDEWDSIQVEV